MRRGWWQVGREGIQGGQGKLGPRRRHRRCVCLGCGDAGRGEGGSRSCEDGGGCREGEGRG